MVAINTISAGGKISQRTDYVRQKQASNLFAIHADQLHSCECIRGTKTAAKDSRQKKKYNEDPAEWNGYDAHCAESQGYRNQYIWVEAVGEKDEKAY